MIKIRVRPPQPVKVGTDTAYLYDPSIVDAEVQQAKDWATKTDGMVEEDGVEVDYSAKAYAVGGTGTTTNNAKYYAEQAGLSATSASSSATSASNSAISASADAGTATTKAGEAATSATNASNSATSASNSATTASDKATIATTQAGIATTAANTATTQAGIATSKATEASGYSSSANVSAQHASTSETNASIWAEGSDGQVALLGGEKSSKGWAARAKEIVDSIGSVLRYKGSVNTRADLPTTGQVIGDMYNILSDGSNVVWNGSDWDDISGIVDLSEYRKAAAQDTIDAGKVPTSRTVNGKALSSDVTLTYTDVGALPDSTVIPTVNNPTITLTQGGVTKGTFTLNQSSNKTIDFDATGATGANTSLSNLTSTGKNIGNWSTNVSNCITEIPQDINLTLENGILTLKTGSKYYRPNGNQYLTTTDKTSSSTSASNGKHLLVIDSGGAIAPAFTDISGPTEPTTPTNGMTWYDTTNNVIKRYWGGTWFGNYSVPIAIISCFNGSYTSIDKVFNGAGYIGHHAFVLPGVTVLVADKYNSDGTLKSIKHTNSSLLISSFGAYTSSGYMIFQNGSIFKPDVYSGFFFQNETPTLTQNKYEYWWCPKDNKWYGHTNTQTSWLERDIVIVGEYGKTSSAFTSFDIRQPVRLATTEMLDTKANDSDVVKLAGNQTIAGTKTFSSTISGSISGNAGTVTNGVYTTGTQTITGDKTFSGAVTLGSSATATTPSAGDNSTSVATTAWLNGEKETIDGWCMPDYNSATQITLPYTATKNGYILRNVYGSSYVHLELGDSGIISYAGAGGNYNSVMIPLAKGDSVSLNASGGTYYIYFIPCKGE